MAKLQVTNDALIAFLRNEGYKPEIQKETNQIYLVWKFDGKDFAQFIRMDNFGKVLNFISFLPCVMKPTAPPEMARLLHLLNKEIDLPGFCMDEKSNLVFYRTTLIALDHAVDDVIFNTIISFSPKIIELFFPTIAAVAGGTKFENITSFVTQLMKKVSEMGKQ